MAYGFESEYATHYTTAPHEDNEVLLPTEYDVIVISPPGGALRYFA